jgi:hypothetical protein
MPMSPAVARWCCTLALVAAGAATPASAQQFTLLMQGTLDARSAITAGGVATPFTGPTAFSVEAVFDVSSPNLVARIPFLPFPVPGFVAYRPSSVQLTIGGRAYALQPYDAANPAGVSVSIFDATTPFFPGLYGVGLIQDPAADGAGFIADFSGASPAYTLAAGGVVPTTYAGYNGVGVSSGACATGTPPNCPKAVTPIPMTWAGQSFGLVLGNYEEDLAPGAAPWTARIVTGPAVVPEPATVALVGAGVLALGVAGARRRRNVTAA